jgi:HAD superfamily hydrolase (TIGR01490 family)
MRIAAFFDIDGTLLAGPTLERRYLRFLRGRGDVGIIHWGRTALHLPLLLARSLREGKSAEWSVLAAENKMYLRGVPCWTMRLFCGWLNRYPLGLFPLGRQQVRWHLAQGHRVFLISGAPAPMVRVAAQEFGSEVHGIGTELVCRAGRWTGEILGQAMVGPAKARCVQRLAAEHQFDLLSCYAYGDSFADRWLLAQVGQRVAVNPTRPLQTYAAARNWLQVAWRPSGTRRSEAVNAGNSAAISAYGWRLASLAASPVTQPTLTSGAENVPLRLPE